MSRYVALAVCALLAGSAIVMTLQSLALAADGSYYLVRILGDQAVFGPDARLFTNAVRQAPVLASAQLGLSDTQLLTLAHGTGQLLLPAVVWSMAVLLARADRLVFSAVSMTAAVCAASTWYFSVSESVLAVPLTVLVAVLLWRPDAWGPHHAALGATASVVLVAGYETAVATGLLLAGWAGWRAAAARTRMDRSGSVLVSAAASASVLVGVVGLQDPSEAPSGQAFLYVLVSLMPGSMYVGLAGITLVVGGSLFSSGTPRRVAITAGALLIVTAALVYEGTVTAAYEARAGATLASIVLLLFLWWNWRNKRSIDTETRWGEEPLLPLFSVVAVGVLLTPALLASADWARSLDAFRAALTRTDGVALADEVLPAERQDVLYDWTSSSLSLIVRSRPTDGVLIDRNPSLVPFPPERAREQLSDDFSWR